MLIKKEKKRKGGYFKMGVLKIKGVTRQKHHNREERENKRHNKNIWNFNHKEIIFFSVLMFVLYLSTLSISLDDWDSVQFALGLQEYSIPKHQPHPPGYPVYIFIGKIFFFFLNNEILALTFFSAISGALCLIFFYFLVYEMFDKKTALISSVLLAVTPIFWLDSLKAMTDIPALLFLMASTYFIYYSIKYNNHKTFYAASFLSAISMGVRFHTLFFLLPILVYSYSYIKNRNIIIKNIFIFFLGILIWFIPILALTGLKDFNHYTWEQFSYRFNNPYTSTLAGDFSIGYVGFRIRDFVNYFLLGAYGIDMNKINVQSLLLLFFIIILSITFLKEFRDKQINFFMVGLIPYCIMVLLLLPPSNPRYFLPLIPLLSLLFTLSILKLEKIKYMVFILFLTLLLIQATPLAIDIHKNPTPPVQLIEYVRENYNYENTFLINNYLRHLSYYKLNIILLYNPSYDEVKKLLNQNKTILSIKKYYPDKFNSTLIKTFERDPRIHLKHYKENLYEIKN